MGKKARLIDKQLLDNYLEGHLSEEETRSVETWLVRHEGEKEVSAFLSKAWKQLPDVRLEEKDREQILDHLKWMIHNHEKKVRRISYWTIVRKIAAILILPILIASVCFIMYHKKLPQLQTVTVATTVGQQKTVMLPDGSQVVLNNQTKLTYQYIPSGNERLALLTGEACFKVKKSKVPFVVKTQDIRVRVLGTEFNVRAYSDASLVQVCLKRGSVLLTGNKTSINYRMIPGQNAVFNKSTKVLKVMKGDVDQIFAWKDGKLVFDDEPLTQVAKVIERKYGVHINIESASLRSDQCRFTTTLQNESLEEILDAINLIIPIHYEQKGNIINIKAVNK